jgi:hypothetical protein
MIWTKSLLSTSLAFLCLAGTLTLIAPSMPAQSVSPSPMGSMSNKDVMALAAAGMPDDVIITKIHSAPATSFDTGVDGLTALKGAGVSSAVIRYMIDPSTPPPTAAPAAPASATAAYDMLDTGVYHKVKGEWVTVGSEPVNWKTGGVMKSIASNGIIKGDMNGHLNGASSKTDVNTPLEFLIKVPDGVEATDYQLVHLHEKSDAREFRTMTGGVFHSSGGATRDAIPFDQKQVARHTYAVTFATPPAPGQYAFLAPGLSNSSASGSTGKAFSFHLVE